MISRKGPQAPEPPPAPPASPAPPVQPAAGAEPVGEAVNPLGNLLGDIASIPALRSALGKQSAEMSVSERAQPAVIAALAEASGRRPLVVCTLTETTAEGLAADLECWLGEGKSAHLPAWGTLPFERMSPTAAVMGARLRLIHLFGGEHPGRANLPLAVTCSVRALMQRLTPGAGSFQPLVVRSGQRLDRDDLTAALIGSGYERGVQVERRGEMAVRGSIVDVFPSTGPTPIRIDLWGDEVERLCEFSVGSQRSGADLSAVEIYGCRELLPTDPVRSRAERLIAEAPWGRQHWERLAAGQFFEGMEAWLPWLTDEHRSFAHLISEEGLVLQVDAAALWARAKEILAEEVELAGHLAKSWNVNPSDPLPSFHVPAEVLLADCEAPIWSIDAMPRSPDQPLVQARAWDAPSADGGPLPQAASLLGEGYRIAAAADGETSAGRLGERLREHGVEPLERFKPAAAPGCVVFVGGLRSGCLLPEAKVGVLTEAELVGRRRPPRLGARRAGSSAGLVSLESLQPGGYVVHRQHGVARYGGMVTRSMDGVEREYLLLEYRDDGRLYVPAAQLDAVRQYTGGEHPRLSRMGGADWQRTKSRAKEAASEVVAELVDLYRERRTVTGHAFPPDGPWQAELEDAFAYVETPDQLVAVEQVKSDMESPRPMDRLICGDVGFGKTEIAVRAAFKAISDGKQVAVLVPTTLLAQQHGGTFSERFASLPVRVEVLSRFLTPAAAREVISGLGSGAVDLVVGTHRLLSSDVRFANLGLLVVDEEQRFGVTHKESIKALRSDVDVLTLTATPIPRTLEMSLTGVRDMSVLHTPPADRRPILTYVGSYDERAVSEAIRREMLRDGQVFFVHNRVEDIDQVAEALGRLVPECRLAVAHGQMEESVLERVVVDFWEGRYDMLVCTTIIESGIDMPTVNTLIVDRADRMGLAQLHQLRGRVGRAGMRAYAYFFTPPDVVLTDDAYERLKVVAESTELGSGIKIAMRDLEIRGAGNLLGKGQSGHIAAVGYDLYCELVSEAIEEISGAEKPAPLPEVSIDLSVDVHLPDDYMPTEAMRFAAYRRLAEVADAADIDDIAEEWLDRFGPLPPTAEALLEVSRIRALCLASSVRSVSTRRLDRQTWEVCLEPLELGLSRLVRMERLYPSADYREHAEQLRIPIPTSADLPRVVRGVFEELVVADPQAGAAA